jgi:hypothetical protein
MKNCIENIGQATKKVPYRMKNLSKRSRLLEKKNIRSPGKKYHFERGNGRKIRMGTKM